MLEPSLTTLLNVLLTGKRGEAPVLRGNDLLAAGELVLGAAEGFDGSGTVIITGADREDDLANVDAGDETIGLSKGTTHSGLQSIGTGTGQHLVDTDDVVWVGADTHVESFLSGNLDEVPVPIVLVCDFGNLRNLNVLVGANAGGF